MPRNRRPPVNTSQGNLFTSHYEEDFLVRTLGDLVRRPEVALSELVANAWDAGAALVKVSIPEKKGDLLVVEDDGCGLTKAEFDQRWMTLGYNRQRNQGFDVEFPPGGAGRRRAYGRNGQGRHGLLCFGNLYEVAASQNGQTAVFEVRVDSGDRPFVSKLISESASKTHGVKVSVKVERNLPYADRIREILSAKFLHDPGFVVSVNGQTLPMTELPGFAGETPLEIRDPESGRVVRLTILVVEGEPGRLKHQSGIAFWIGGRLVGEPGWTVMGQQVIDGRTKPGRRLTVVVKSEDMYDDVLPDWTNFRTNNLTREVGRVVVETVLEKLALLYSARVRETTAEVLTEFKPAMEVLGRGERVEVAEVAQSIAKANPLVAADVLSAAVAGVIEAKKSISIQLLMKRIESLPADDIAGLHRLLDEWSVRDALTVLDEIGRRLRVVEAIQKLMGDKSVDELHVLHPLVTQARWLFGPEYDSPHYSANLGLRKAMEKVFGVEAGKASFQNPKKRPDLLVRGDTSLSGVASEDIDLESKMATCRRVLLVELKKGGFRIGRDEMDQAGGYIEDLANSGLLAGKPFIHAFVVGHELDPLTTPVRTVGDPVIGRIEAHPFGQLVQTANARLFRIRDQVEDRYPDDAAGLLAQLKSTPKEAEQLGITFPAGPPKSDPSAVPVGKAVEG